MAVPFDVTQDVMVDNAHLQANFDDLDLRATALEGGGVTTEAIQDTVGAMCVDSATVDATHDDGAGTQSFAVKDASIGDAKLVAGIDAAKIGDGSVSNTEFQHLGTVSSNVQTQLDGKAATSHATQHRPGGSDPIPTAAAAGLANANAEGGATSLARSDHTHKRDVRVFSGGAEVATRNALNFTGAGVSVTEDAINDRLTIDIPGGGAGSDSKVSVFQDTTQVGSTSRRLGFEADDFDVVEDAGNDLHAVSLADNLDSTARVAVRKNSDASNTGARRRLNLIEGSNVTLTVADDAANEEIDVTIAAAAGSITVQEADGTPSATATTIQLPNGSLTDNGGGSVRYKPLETIMVPLSDEATIITTGTAKYTFYLPFAMTLSELIATLSTASSSGVVTVDVNVNGSTILTTKLTIDANETTSLTAAAAYVLSSTALAKGDKVTFDIDTAGTGAVGLKVALNGVRA